MIKLTKDGQAEGGLPDLGYVDRPGWRGRLIMPLTRYLRAKNAGRYLAAGERHLDLGCGDGYFLRRSPCAERIGLDPRLGDQLDGRLDFPADHFDYVTMLAVIEHVGDPAAVFAEAHRVLKPGGRFILTTPKRAAAGLIRLYFGGVDEEHESYFDQARIEKLAGNNFSLAGRHRFALGLNQAFCLVKNQPREAGDGR